MCISVNHIRFPKEDRLRECARRDNKATQGGRLERFGVPFRLSNLVSPWDFIGP